MAGESSMFPSMECPICFQTMDEPTSFKCLHTCCKNCLIQLIVDKQIEQRRSNIRFIRNLVRRYQTTGLTNDDFVNLNQYVVLLNNQELTVRTTDEIEQMTEQAAPDNRMTNSQMKQQLKSTHQYLDEAIDLILTNEPVEISCSYCRAVEAINDTDLSVYTNFAMKSLIEEIKKFAQSNEEAKRLDAQCIKCTACGRSLKNKSMFKCRSCSASYLCGECIANNHLGHRGLRKMEHFDHDKANCMQLQIAHSRLDYASSKNTLESNLAQILANLDADIHYADIQSRITLDSEKELTQINLTERTNLDKKYSDLLAYVESVSRAVYCMSKLSETMVKCDLETLKSKISKMEILFASEGIAAYRSGYCQPSTSGLQATNTHKRVTRVAGQVIDIDEPSRKQKRTDSPQNVQAEMPPEAQVSLNSIMDNLLIGPLAGQPPDLVQIDDED